MNYISTPEQILFIIVYKFYNYSTHMFKCGYNMWNYIWTLTNNDHITKNKLIIFTDTAAYQYKYKQTSTSCFYQIHLHNQWLFKNTNCGPKGKFYQAISFNLFKHAYIDVSWKGKSDWVDPIGFKGISTKKEGKSSLDMPITKVKLVKLTIHCTVLWPNHNVLWPNHNDFIY